MSVGTLTPTQVELTPFYTLPLSFPVVATLPLSKQCLLLAFSPAYRKRRICGVRVRAAYFW